VTRLTSVSPEPETLHRAEPRATDSVSNENRDVSGACWLLAQEHFTDREPLIHELTICGHQEQLELPVREIGQVG